LRNKSKLFSICGGLLSLFLFFTSDATYGLDFEQEFTVVRVKFAENTTQVYGYDDYTNPDIPWKSVETSRSDTAKVDISPVSALNKVYFVSTNIAAVTVSPTQATSSPQTITLEGGAKGESDVRANMASEEGKAATKIDVAAYDKIVKTVALIPVRSPSDPGTDVNVNDVVNFLNKKAYNQAVVEWNVFHMGFCTANFDLNKDGLIDVKTWMTDEMIVVRDTCKNDTFDYNIFLVDHPSDGSFGFMDFGPNQRYGFVHVGEIVGASCNVNQVVAHELGHGAFGLTHPNEEGQPVIDAANLMTWFADFSPWRLRKYQWDKINP